MNSSFMSQTPRMAITGIRVDSKGRVKAAEPERRALDGSIPMPATEIHLHPGTYVVWMQRFPARDGRAVDRPLGMISVDDDLIAYLRRLGRRASWDEVRDAGFGLPMPE